MSDTKYLFLLTEKGTQIRKRIIELSSKGGHLGDELLIAASILKLVGEMINHHKAGRSAFAMSFIKDDTCSPYTLPKSILEIDPDTVNPGNVTKMWEEFISYMSYLLMVRGPGWKKKRKQIKVDHIIYHRMVEMVEGLLDEIFGPPSSVDGQDVYDNITPPHLYVLHIEGAS